MSVEVNAGGLVLMSGGSVLTASGAGATFDFYISPTGNDANAGTLGAPWAITSLISNNSNNSKMVSKRVGFLPGTYNVCGTTLAGSTLIGNGSFPSNGSYCALSIPAGSSSASTYVGTSDSSGHYSPRTATIVLNCGQNSSTTDNKWNNAIIGRDQTSTSGWVTIDGLVINGNGAAGKMDCVGPNGNEGAHMCFFQSTDGSFTAAGSMDGCVVQNCDLSGINATDAGGNDAAIWFQGCKNGIAQGNYIHDINKSNDISHCHGIESYGCTNLQWINNTFFNCTGGAMEPKEGNSGIIAAYNYIYSCATVASGNYAVFQAWDGAQGNPNSPNVAYSIHHNIIDSCGRVTFGESNNANHTMALNWYNNTIYESGQIVLQSTGGGGLMNHYNNIDVLATPTTAYKQFTTSGWTTLDYNCMYVENSTYTSVWQESGTNYSSLAAWQAAPGSPDAHGITSDPKFTPGTLNIVAGGGPSQFKLQGGSPCVGTGQGGVDMGAWQGQTTIGCGFGPYA